MTDSRDNDKFDALDFSWGKKKTKGGKNKDVQFYESFTYDGVEYFLYDSVYLFKDGEVEPYIGKLIKIWEQSKRSRKVKVLWFFKPSEILHYMKGVKVLQNELFLASGEGVGLANINPLEAIAGKCNVLCISKDERNCQPSTEDLEKADYVFYRTFDVANFTISDKLGEKIAATEVRFLLNKKDFQLANVTSGDKNVGNVVVGIDVPLASVESTPREDEAAKCDTNAGALLMKDDVDTKDAALKQKLNAPQNHSDAGSDHSGTVALLAAEHALVSGQKTRSSSPDYDLIDLDKVIESAVNVGQSKNKTSQKSELGVIDTMDKTKNDNQKFVNSGINSAKELTPLAATTAKGKSERAKDINFSVGSVGEVKTIDNRAAMEERPSKKPKLDGTAAPSSNKGKNGARKSLIVSSASNQASGSAAAFTAECNDKGKLAEEFDGTSNGLSKKLTSKRVSSGSAVAETNARGKLGKESVGTGFGQSKKLKSEPVDPGSGVAVASEKNGAGKLGKDSVGTSNGISKKLDCEGVEDKSNTRLPKASLKQCKNEEIEAYGHVKEVTRRPKSGRSHWFGAEHWNDSLRTAQNQGTLVLLQNLDPGYTSSEVEDIVWHGFGESCTAKILPKTAISSPYSGEAFVIFKTREAAKRVSYKLDHECLMLPNGRPLVGSLWVSSLDGNQSSFPGHLVIDKLRYQSQREAKAVSTSHSSQSNTVEYEMAIDWRLLQDQADLWWRLLYKEQGRELRKLKANFKSKK